MYSFSSSDASLSLQMAFEEGRTLANEATACSRIGESERDQGDVPFIIQGI